MGVCPEFTKSVGIQPIIGVIKNFAGLQWNSFFSNMRKVYTFQLEGFTVNSKFLKSDFTKKIRV